MAEGTERSVEAFRLKALGKAFPESGITTQFEADGGARDRHPGRRSRLAARMFSCGIWAYRRLAARPGIRRHLSDIADAVLRSRASGLYIRCILWASRHRGTAPLARLLLLGLRLGFSAMAAAHLACGSPARMLQVARVTNLAFRSSVRRRDETVTATVFVGYYEAGDLAWLKREIASGLAPRGPLQQRLTALALLKTGDAARALICLQDLAEANPDSALAQRLLGRAFVLVGDHASAGIHFRKSVALQPQTVMAYHNSAGRYDVAAYVPKPWEIEHAESLLVYDALAQQAEETAFIGDSAGSLRAGKAMLAWQQWLAERIAVPEDLLLALAGALPGFDPGKPFRLLPWEWVTQIGHLGMVVAHRKMADLGVVAPAQHILLAPADKVANAAFLDYVAAKTLVLRDPGLIDRLFGYQRIVGDNFMFTRLANGEAVPWVEGAAEAQRRWDEAGLGPAMMLCAADREFGEQGLRRLGIAPDARLVGLHVREGGFHGEPAGAIGEHRNADAATYLPALDRILAAGGTVVRFGDSSMSPLPNRPGLIEYGRSTVKSARMDVFLMARCEFIIGTTSGLTSAAQAFDTPMLLMNCISTDVQFWPANVRFATKQIADKRDGRILGWRETCKDPVQGLLVSSTRLRRRGYRVIDNSPRDITRAVAWMLEREGAETLPDRFLSAYRHALRKNPLVFGNALPIGSFLEDHPGMLADGES